MHAPGYRAIVDGAASRLIAIVLDRDGCGPRIAVGSPGNGLAFDVGAQILPLEITQLIVRIKVLCGESRTALRARSPQRLGGRSLAKLAVPLCLSLCGLAT